MARVHRVTPASAPLRPSRPLGSVRLSGARPSPSTPGAITFPTTDLACRVYLALGADLTQPPTTWSWTEITSPTSYVRFDAGVSTTQGRPDWTSTVRTSSGQLTLDNRDGRFSRRNPNGPYYGQLTYNTPIWCTVDAGSGPQTRMQMFVNEWPTRWDRSGNDSYVPIQCAGIMRRLQQGAVLKSAMRRAILATATTASLLGFWSLEDGTSALAGSSGLVGGASTSTYPSTVTPGVSSLAAGSAAAVDLSGGGTFTAPTGQAAGVAPNGWEFEFIASWDAVPSVPVSQFAAIAWAQPSAASTSQVGVALQDFIGTTYFAQVFVDPATGFASSGIRTDLGPVVAGHAYHIRLVASQSGGNVVLSLYVDGVQGADATSADTLLMPDRIVVNNTGRWAVSAASNPDTFTQLAFWAPYRTTATTYQAASGYTGELATTRIRRLATEERVPMVCTSGVSVAMGPQPLDTFLNLLRDCETVDGGVLYEVNWGLGYQSLNDRTNMPVSLALDKSLRHVAVEPEPADDDQRLRNRWHASRPTGSEVIAEQTTGPLGTQAGGPGLYDDSVAPNVYLDSQLLDEAGWRRHLGTVDEDRWPSIAIRLHGTPDLIPAWVAMPFGARMTLSNPPSQVAPDVIDAVVEGWSERWDTKTWVATLNTAPFSPYRTGTLAADAGDTAETLLILVPDTLALAADVNTTDTSWQVNSSPLWTTNSEMFPRRIMWEGEEIRLTNCTGASAPQTWTVVRSINGVVKSHTANSSLLAYRGILHPGVLTLA